MRILQNFKLLGLVFLCLLLAGVYLTYGIFSKKFVDYDEVKLQTSTIGLQLPARADVKIRGVIVGEVLAFDSNAEGAELTLGLYPDKIDTIPADVTGAIVPKTLFGEKYVSLVVPDDPDADHIEPGATIERTQVATEVEKVLSDLYPLLRTVQPAAINQTLNALATALEGRGEQIGENLETVDSYLKRINPQIPAIVEDLRLTADVSDTYASVMPQIAEILRNTVKTTGTLKDREAKLNALFTDVHRLLEHRHRLPPRQRRQPDPAEQGGGRAAPRLREVRARVPLPDQGDRERRQAPGRGVPRLHAAHRARDAAEPAPRVRRPGRASVRRGPRAQLPAPAQPALVAVQPGAAPAGLQRRRGRAHRQGDQPGRPELLPRRAHR